MALRKSRDGSWIVDVSNGINPISLKQRRIVRKGFKTKKEALEAEQYLRSVELKEKSFNSKISIDILYDLLKEEDKINNRKQSYIDTQENNYNRHIKSYFEKVDDVSTIPTETISEKLGGVEISEQDNVSKVLAAVVEGSCEVGTTYYSDTYGYEDELNILQTVSYDLTGNVIYPIAQVKNDEASDAEVSEAKDFIDFVTSDKAKTIFQKYYFDTDVE